MTAKIHLISIGNGLRGDDGVAQSVCRSLPEATLKNVRWIDLGPYTSLISQALDGCRSAVIVDAVRGDGEVGEHVRLSLANLVSGRLKARSSHGFSFADELCVLGRQQCFAAGDITFFGIEVGQTDFGEGLSPELSAQIPALSLELANLLESMLCTK